MTMNLRVDQTFVQDEGWYTANKRYSEFINTYEQKKILYLELGIGRNTPTIIKYPFWRQTKDNPQATYACLNLGETYIPDEIEKQSIPIDGDIGNILRDLLRK